MGINSPEISRDRVKEIKAYHCVARELWRAIGRGEVVPGWIAVYESKLRIKNVADDRASLEGAHDPGKVPLRRPRCAGNRFARPHAEIILNNNRRGFL